MSFSLHIAPMLEHSALITAAVMAGLGVVLAVFGGPAARWRVLGFLALLTVLLNPVGVDEKRESVSDVALVVVDRSPSQKFGERQMRTDAALAHVKEKLAGIEGLETQVVEVSSSRPAGEGDGTYLFEEVRRAWDQTAKDRAAGVILITDGQVHDPMPVDGAGPIHAVLTGSKSEKDRAVVLESTPSYGVVGEKVTFSVKIRETGMAGGPLALRVSRDGEELELVTVTPDEAVTLSYALPHGGANFFEFSVDAVPGELTGMNNRAVVSVNGVRDRLKVLLISGEPYPGERTWRNLLKSDPSVDLVHFTILRSPDTFDPTPQNELSLIAFPVDELFEQKIRQFDLIIFDRFEFRNVLTADYLRNIANYVRNGGALLMAGGPDYISEDGLYKTEVGDVLPAKPLGSALVETPFYPTVTEKGLRHPVMKPLADRAETAEKQGKPAWGRWFRQARVDAGRGQVLMSGANDLPLLVFDRVGEGRVAQLTSDQIWLWNKGIDGGGPQAEFLRRLVHWLMKEPELEENTLAARIDGGVLKVERHALDDAPFRAVASTPSGKDVEMTMKDAGKGIFAGQVSADEEGVYKVSDGTNTVFAAAGDLLSPELADIESTGRILDPVARASGGAVFYYDEKPDFGIRSLSGKRDRWNGNGWIGLRHNAVFRATDTVEKLLFPVFASLMLLLGALLAAWLREGYASFRKTSAMASERT